ncbi:hypothetical protein [Devosia chinhatensis]|uniref:Chitin-binding type-3 domain-containing protein n=1 Tax=Devosia chinhatensis TaxID=429727 RepID=A0A0F5FLG6_9HYPH|nr:hypothetical protein [Devosia chinhatensis]KKB09415.1 hypothetical protein VE26_05630 [Devosia chinhatensis]
MAEPYSVGTITVSNGDTVVVGTNTFWIGSVRKNDMLLDPAQGLIALITADATDNNELTIDAWPGVDIVDGEYKIIPAGDSTSNTARLRELLADMSVIEANGRGLFYRFSDTTTDGDPGAGFIRLNNATIASVTVVFIDVLDANGASAAGEIDSWDDSTSLTKGRLWLRSIADPSAFHAFVVTGSVVDGTGYRKLTVEHIGGSGSFSASEEIMVAFAPTGDRGDSYVTDATVADPSELTAYESETAGFLVFVTDLETDFGAYAGRSGVVRLIAGPDWELVAIYTGPQGAASTVPGPTGPIGVAWKGTYSGATAYVLNDGVLHNGSSWRALGSTTGNAPPTLPTTSNTYWSLIARAGTDGAGTVSSIVAGTGISVDSSDPAAPVVSAVQENTTLSIMAIQIADNSNAALFMGDGVADAFDTLTYVDVAGASNLNSATTGVLKPTTGTDTYATSANPALTANSTGYGGYSTRELVPASALTVSGDKVRLTLTPPTSGANTPIDDVWIGHVGGTAPNFDGTQVRVTFAGGATGVTLVAGGASVVSDAIDYALDETKDLVVSFDFGATADVRRNSAASGYNSYQKAVTSGDGGSTVVSGYTPNADFLAVLDLIEVRTAAAAANNMTVRSNSFTAPVIPQTLRAVLMVKQVGGSSVAGTDYKLELSRDGGATFNEATLTEKFTLQNGITVVEAAALDVTAQPSANNPRWRFSTLNNKNIELYGVHFLWPTGSSP